MNREYANWSRFLREVVEYWGSVAWDEEKDEKWNYQRNRVKGPFFGMNYVMVISEYNIRFCGQPAPHQRCKWHIDLVVILE